MPDSKHKIVDVSPGSIFVNLVLGANKYTLSENFSETGDRS